MAFRVHVDMTAEVYHRVKQYAYDRDQNIEAVITELVEKNLPTTGASFAVDAVTQREIAAFQSMHAFLRASFGGEYVAICEERVVDHDVDLSELHSRIEERYPDRFILIRPVGENSEREFHFRSPRNLERVP